MQTGWPNGKLWSGSDSMPLSMPCGLMGPELPYGSSYLLYRRHKVPGLLESLHATVSGYLLLGMPLIRILFFA